MLEKPNLTELRNDLKLMFQVNIAHSPSMKEWFATIYSPTDQKQKVLHGTDFPKLVKSISKGMGEKERDLRMFPLPVPEPAEESRIIIPNGTNGQ